MNIKRYITFAFALCASGSLFGTNDIYVQNNTPIAMSVLFVQLMENDVKQISGVPSSDLNKIGKIVAQSDTQWRQKVATLPAWSSSAQSSLFDSAKGFNLGFIGAKDMKDSQANYFKVIFRPQGSKDQNDLFTLILRVGPKEKPNPSLEEARLWERIDYTSCKGLSKTTNWVAKGDQEILPLKLQGKCLHLFFKQKEFDNEDNQIWINITEEPPAAENRPANGLRIMSYNLYMLPFQDLSKDVSKALSLFGISAGSLATLNTGADQRAEERRIPRYIAPLADVFAFQEGFDTAGRQELRSNMKKAGIAYSTEVLGRDNSKSGRLTNSGLFFMSRYPIVASDGIYYQDKFGDKPKIDSFGSDDMADKGIYYAKIMKDNKPYHIFTTHAQSGGAKKNEVPEMGTLIRALQVARMKDFIDSKNIPATEPVIIVGDFNIDRGNPLTRADRYAEYKNLIKTVNATLVEAQPGYVSSWFDPDTSKKYSSKGALIDYIMYSNDHLKPKNAYSKIYYMFADDPWDDKKYSYLSDHNPIVGVFEF